MFFYFFRFFQVKKFDGEKVQTCFFFQAIELNPNNAVFYANRSISYLRTECFGYALTDASKAIEVDKNYLKGYYRRASAYMSLGKYQIDKSIKI